MIVTMTTLPNLLRPILTIFLQSKTILNFFIGTNP